uniref:Brix domain-containing protein n=1 Tax=Arcella intermedia TaxID=1963864 RepID=A0A6B2LBB2_9EUKA
MKRIRTGYINKQHVLVISSKGIGARYRHLMNDVRDLMPHSKKDVKMDSRHLGMVNEIGDMKGCNGAVVFEGKGKEDLYMWFTRIPDGPSVKFQATNVHTMSELKFTGNCLKYSRPLLQFDSQFDEEPHWQLIKELFIQIFSTPNMHPRSKPFIDHILSFNIAAGRIWFRNYQVTEEFKPDQSGNNKMERVLVEIGPRFVLHPVKIFSGSFFGSKLYENENFISPAMLRSLRRRKKAAVHTKKQLAVQESRARIPEKELPLTPLDTLFDREWEVVEENKSESELTQSSHAETEPKDDEDEDDDDEGDEE